MNTSQPQISYTFSTALASQRNQIAALVVEQKSTLLLCVLGKREDLLKADTRRFEPARATRFDSVRGLEWLFRDGELRLYTAALLGCGAGRVRLLPADPYRVISGLDESLAVRIDKAQ